MNAKEIESLEKRYFDEIAFFVEKNIHWFLERLKSKNEIKKDATFHSLCNRWVQDLNLRSASAAETGVRDQRFKPLSQPTIYP